MYIDLIEKNKDKYVLCATPEKGFMGNSLLFWGKNNCGYYADLNLCEFYTYKEVMQHATKNDIPIKVSDLQDLSIHCEHHAYDILHNAKEKYTKKEVQNV